LYWYGEFILTLI